MSVLSFVVALTCLALPIIDGQSFNGTGVLTFYDNAGSNACGPNIDAANDNLAAVPQQYWTAGNPNEDPICKKCVSVSYDGKSIKVPIIKVPIKVHKCPPAGCDAGHIALSKPAFSQLANPDVGRITTASWSIVDC